MTKAEALFDFWSGFGLVAYEENAVPAKGTPDAPEYPYLTYEVKTARLGVTVPLSASLWYRSASWKEANAKEKEISDFIGSGGVFLDCDGGALWIHRGELFASRAGDTSDDMIKRIDINVSVEFWTED